MQLQPQSGLADLDQNWAFTKGHDFHSFRHTVATQFKRFNAPSVVAVEILGHAQNNIAYNRYGKKLELDVLKDTVDLINSDVVQAKKDQLDCI